MREQGTQHKSPSPFLARADIVLKPSGDDDRSDDDAFELKATVTLGAGSNGIDPLTEEVRLEVGTFSTTIPASSFVPTDAGPLGEFRFEGIAAGGVRLEMRIRPLGGGTFEFRAEGEETSLAGTVNPVTVKLRIGDDAGSTEVLARIKRG